MRFVVSFVLLCASVVLLAQAYSVQPDTVEFVAAAKSGQHLWKPSNAVSLTPSLLVARLSMSEDRCALRKPAADGGCRFAILYSLNAGKDFEVDDRSDVADFCGSSGLIEQNTISCFHSPTIQDKTEEANFTLVSFKLRSFVFPSEQDGDTSKKIQIEERAEEAVFNLTNVTTEPLDQVEPAGIASGLQKHNTTFWSASLNVLFKNGTWIHIFCLSQNGLQWNYTSTVPIPVGHELTLHVLSATRLMIFTGEPNNLTEITTRDRGSSWGKSSSARYVTTLSALTTPFGTTMYAGMEGRPGLTGLVSAKKAGAEKRLHFAQFHNVLLTGIRNGELNTSSLRVTSDTKNKKDTKDKKGKKETKEAKESKKKDDNATSTNTTNEKEEVVVEEEKKLDPNQLKVMQQKLGDHTSNFSESFLVASEFNCGADVPPDQQVGCETSSYATVLRTSESSFVVLYDKLATGFAKAVKGTDHSIYAMHFTLDESAERKEAEKKLEAEREAQEKRKKDEERRQEAKREEALRRLKKKKEERLKKKAKRIAFMQKDVLVAEAALKAKELDNEIILVRKVVTEEVQFEKDSFFDSVFNPPNFSEEDKTEADSKADVNSTAKETKKSSKK